MQSYTDINRAATKKKNNRKIYVRDKLLSFNKDQLRDLKIYTSRSVNNFLQTLLSQLIARFFISYLLVTYLHYYIHTEKHSPKSYVVNFRTQISSSQSEERTMVFTREKNDTSNQKPQCEFRAKIPTFYCSLQRRFAGIQRE